MIRPPSAPGGLPRAGSRLCGRSPVQAARPAEQGVGGVADKRAPLPAEAGAEWTGVRGGRRPDGWGPGPAPAGVGGCAYPLGPSLTL